MGNITVPELHVNTQYMNNTRLVRTLIQQEVAIDNTEREYDFTYDSSGEKCNIITLCSKHNVQFDQKLTAFDKMLMDAIYTIQCSGNDIFTAEQIAKVMYCNEKLRVTPGKLDSIRKCVDKLCLIRVRIDCTNEVNSRKKLKKRNCQVIYESYLLPVEQITVQYGVNGKSTTAYRLLCKACMFEYAELLKQIISIPTEAMDTHAVMSDTECSMMVKRYVTERVMQIIRKNNINNECISLSWEKNGEQHGLFSYLGYVDDGSARWRTKDKPRIVQCVKNTLDGLIKSGYIQGYEEYRAGGSTNPAKPVVGFRIIT